MYIDYVIFIQFLENLLILSQILAVSKPVARVIIDDALDTVYSRFPKSLRDSLIPVYSSNFYKNASKALDEKWSAHNVYTHLFNDRRQLETLLFSKLDIIVQKEKVIKPAINDLSNIEFLYEGPYFDDG